MEAESGEADVERLNELGRGLVTRMKAVVAYMAEVRKTGEMTRYHQMRLYGDLFEVMAVANFGRGGAEPAVLRLESHARPLQGTDLEIAILERMGWIYFKQEIDDVYTAEIRNQRLVDVYAKIADHPEWMRHPDDRIKAHHAALVLELATYLERSGDIGKAADRLEQYFDGLMTHDVGFDTAGIDFALSSYGRLVSALPLRQGIRGDEFSRWADANERQHQGLASPYAEQPLAQDLVRAYEEQIEIRIIANLEAMMTEGQLGGRGR
ncbi:MAG: hypothetical protein AAF604_07905 [Acidobacteriota bacterium]